MRYLITVQFEGDEMELDDFREVVEQHGGFVSNVET